MTGLEIAFIAASAIGTMMSAMGTMRQQQQQAQQQYWVARQQQQQAHAYRVQATELQYNADRAREDRHQADLSAAMKRMQIQKAGDKAQGTARAAAAASGLEISEGSALELLGENAEQIELDRLIAQHEGDTAATKFDSEERLSRYRAGQALHAAEFGTSISEASFGAARETAAWAPFSAAGVLLQGAGGIYKTYQGPIGRATGVT